MHRSGTSLAASVLRRAGLHLGGRLNGPGPGNPRGHFEDLDVWRLHDEMLAAAGHTPLSPGDDFEPPRGDGFERRAAALVAARAGQRAWGWKDPRTCLFLDFWEPLVPEASYLVLYRHPVDVVLSLLRRNTEPEVRDDPRLAFRAWSVHNRRLLAWIDRHRERCLVAQAPAIAGDLEGLVRRLADRFELPLDPAGGRSLFVPEELAPSVPEAQRPPWARIFPEELELYERLEEIADLAGPPAPTEPPVAGVEGEPEPDPSAARAVPELRLSEALLYDLLEARALRRQQRSAVEAFASALEEERARLAVTQRELGEEQARHRDAAARRDELGGTLATIERSRAFRLVSGWWRLVGRVRRR